MPKARKPSDYPPNPAQWPAERNGMAFRQRFDVAVHVPLKPLTLGPRIPGVKLVSRAELEAIAAPEDVAELFGPARDRWSGITIPLPDGNHLVILNDTHAATRQNATVMEEYFHILLKHKGSSIMTCSITGLAQRKYDRAMEQEAYWSAAAALLPYSALRARIDAGQPAAEIAAHFETSSELVAFRLKVTKLWKRACA